MEQTGSNTKMISGFLAGMVVAGGSAYFYSNRQASPTSLKAPEPITASSKDAPTVAAEVSSLPAATSKSIDPKRFESAAHPQHSPQSKWRASAEAPKVVNEQPQLQASTPSPTPQHVPTPEPVAVPAPVVVAEQQPHPAPTPRQAQSVTIAAGTLLPIRLNEAISSEKKVSNDPFTAVLSEPLVINGMVIAERGARAEGRIVDVTRAGKVKGLAHLALELTHFISSDGQKVKIQTALFEKEGPSSKKKDVGKVAVGAGVGAALGAIFGGGKGAAIGAGAGGGAAEGVVLLTRGEPAVLPVETRISFRITDSVTITEKLR